MNNNLEVKGLSKEFDVFLLDTISFNLPVGGIMGFVGQNGAGKTTIIRLILNMLKRNSGKITVFGLDNIDDELSVKQDLAVVFDEIFFIETWRINDVEMALKRFYKHWDSKLY